MAQRRIPAFGQVGNEVVDATLPTFGTDDGSTDNAPDDPLAALHTLLTNGDAFAPAPRVSGGNRNAAIAGGIRKKYGLGPDDGSISQSDLEALDSMFRGNDVQDAVTKAVAPINAKGAIDLQGEGMKDQNALDVENLKGQSARDVAAINAAGRAKPAPADQSGEVNAWITAIKSGVPLAQVPAGLRSAVVQGGVDAGDVDMNPMTNQTRQMSETANDLLPMIDAVQSRAQMLQSKNAFDLVNSPVRQWLVSHGMGSIFGATHSDPSLADEAGRFQTDLGLLQSGVARAHAGARGAGNNGMAERFEKLMNAQGDLPTFLGELQGVRDLLTTYAKHTNPNVLAADPYADPNYQPK